MRSERVRRVDEPVLEVASLSAAYGPHRVLDDVTVEVHAGQVVAVSGSNGAGKSTLLRCLAGLIPFSGEAWVDGVAVGGGRAVRRLVGYLPQAVQLPEHATVGEVIAFFARLRGVDVDRDDLPDGFLPPEERPIGVLSGGQRQRVALAVALLGEPRLLLLDEPVANLDERGREGFWQALRARAERGSAALVAAPTPSDLLEVADRAIVLHDGRVESDGPMHGVHAVATRPADAVEEAARLDEETGS